jgi:hypothetical protein
MRYVFLLMALVGFFVTFTTKSPGTLGVGLLVGIIGTLGFVLSMAAARIAANAQPETTLIVDPEVNALRKRALQERKLAAKPAATADDDADRGQLT